MEYSPTPILAADLTTVLLAITALFVISGILMCVKVVKQAQCMVIEKFGKFNRILESGLNIIVPVMDSPRAMQWRYKKVDISGVEYVMTAPQTTIDLREQVFDFAKQNVITRDNVTIEIDAMLYFQITDVKAAVYEIANLPDAIEKLCKTSLRNVVGKLTLDECLTSRDKINSELLQVMDDATDKWGVKVNRVELKDITPPMDIQQAMEKQMRAERDRRAAILNAEGEKQAAILQAEGVRESQIKQAEGEKQALVLEATGQAEARIKVAEAERNAIQLIQESLSGTKSDPAQYLVAIRYLESLKEMTSGKDNKVVYVPYEATGVLGSLGGIKDLLSGIGGKN
ncbi:MAG: SPFH domain-containing protein [Verrucomicrobiota bacterium]|jgi:regulator of protease activity HflC (stomatin/prohibitin superfamily)|nr:SPFH domain-containing protein [Verrucomicrobiota bacterium]